MMIFLQSIFFSLLGYCFGSINAAIIVCKLMRLPDPRTEGSHNPGASNVLRLGGKTAGAITLLVDVFKSFLPVLIIKLLGFADPVVALTGVGAFLGHLYPVLFKFEGGKGVATAFGCFYVFSPISGFCLTLIWLGVLALSFYASVASLSVAILAPVILYYFTGNTVYTIAAIFMSIMMFIRHRANIVRLLAGKETRFR